VNGANIPYIFDGGDPLSVYSVGPAFDAGGVSITGPTGGTNLILQLRRGTSSQWSSANTRLADGEIGLETDTRQFKIGNGATGWTGLGYGGLQGPIGATGSIPSSVATFAVTDSLTITGITSLQEIQETVVPVASPGASTTLSWFNGAVYYVTSMASNFTVNITNLPITTNRVYVVTLILIQGASAFLPNVLQIAGTGVTIRWPNASAPTATANRFEVVAFTLYYSGSTWLALGQLTSFG
jgi:hypothetical protein